MSSSSATAPGSRSSSPATPEASDGLEPVAVHHDFEASPWYHTIQSGKTWDTDATFQFDLGKGDEEHVLRLDDLIEDHAYDDSPNSEVNLTLPSSILSDSNVVPSPSLSPSSFSALNPVVPSHNTLMSLTKPIPPPASRPRKRDLPTANQKVVFPPKESCYNLPIMVPSIPEGGTKSRVETQVRVTVDLADGNFSDPSKYDRVGSWKWLKLPQGTATKKRTRKQGKIDPVAPDILHLSASVTCASPPYYRVLSCSSCQAREAKRVARKLAARVRPARSDSDSPEDINNTGAKSRQEDTTSIIQFNCAEVLDFSTGSVVLPLRITCYCRHHREKVGFNIHFTMMDDAGRIVGTGTSQPIMITDDHKSPSGGPVSRHANMVPHSFVAVDTGWQSASGTIDVAEMRAPSKRKQSTAKETTGTARKRVKPYNTNNRSKPSRETSVSSFPSPTTSQSALPSTSSPTPQYNSLEAPNSSILGNHTLESNVVSPSDITRDQITDIFSGLDHLMPSRPEGQPSPAQGPSSAAPFTPSALMQHNPSPFIFFDPGPQPPLPSLPMPKIHRLIPACGPTHGGIEVTVLGANFHPSVQLHCVFGDVVASSTQRWSDNTLVCVLPPRVTAGVVAVWFDGFSKEEDGTPPSLFTYSDESDRALMELALQVVGLKMTGKIEDAKNVAMRIVGNAGESSDSPDMMRLSSTSVSVRNIRPLLLTRATGDSKDFESLIVDFLAILDTPLDHQSPTSISSAISYQTASGQTLLHLAAFLGFSALLEFLVSHGIDLDVRDRNGCSALHFSVLRGSKACARILNEAGADMEIVNVLGRTPQEVAPAGFFEDDLSGEGSADSGPDDVDGHDDEEAHWGDGEEDEDEIVRTGKWLAQRRVPRRVEHGAREASTEDVCDESVSRATAPTQETSGKEKNREVVDEKQTASFVEMIQRTLAQLYAAQGIMPNMPQLPLPNLPQLPGMPTVPWGALPQIPMVFPVFVPMPGWPSFLADKRGEHTNNDGKEPDESAHSKAVGTIRAAQEWKATWEKWMALTMRQQQTEEVPPPMYTPRAAEDGPSGVAAELRGDQREDRGQAPVRLSSAVERAVSRPFGYGVVPISDQEVNAYGYQPTTKQSQKLQKKHDRMLLLFWLPTLLLALLWAFHSGLRFMFHAIKAALPLKVLARG